MEKFDIMTDTFEFRMGTRRDRIPAMSGREIFETYRSGDTRITSNSLDPVREASFETLEEAKAAFSKGYANYGRTRLEKTGSGSWILTGELAWIEGNEYDDDGNLDQGGWDYELAAEDYEGED